jgi:hypothetical protein
MLPLFFGFFTVKYFSPSSRASPGADSQSAEDKKRASDRHRRPVLTSETTKRKSSNIFPCSIILYHIISR